LKDKAAAAASSEFEEFPMADQTSPMSPDTSARDAKTSVTPKSGDLKQPHTSIDPEAETHVVAEDWKAPAAPAAPAAYAQIAHYRIIKKLGQGGMGIVFHAEDIHLQRPVALKVMRPQFADDEARHRFVREARAMAAVKHPHIVTVFQVGEDRGAPFLAMEFLEGESLHQRIERIGRLPVAEVCRIGREIAAGLAAAHDKGLIHRDIKPANIWLEGKQGHVKILDFGLARTHSDQAHLTQTGAILGTPAYMAPEQAAGERVDHRCDLFSLGCVLYQLSSGEMAFKGSNTMSILSALAVTEPAPLKSVNPDLSDALSDLVAKLLAKKPEGRPATAQEVVDALNAVEQNRTVAMAKPKPPPRPAAPKPAAAVVPPAAKVVPVPKPPAPKRKTETSAPIPQVAAKNKPRLFRTKQRGPLSRHVVVLLILLAAGLIGLALWASGVIHFSTNQRDLALETRPGAAPQASSKPTKRDADNPQRIGSKPAESLASSVDRKVAEWVLSLGGAVRINGEPEGREIKLAEELPKGQFTLTNVNLQKAPVSNDDLARLKGLDGLIELDLGDTKVTDPGLIHLKGLKRLARLSLHYTAVTDAGLIHLRDLGELVHLWLGGTQVTDEGLDHLRDFKALKRLGLNWTRVSDAGLSRFRNLKGLTTLWLGGLPVTDVGLANLRDCKELTYLYVGKTKVTAKGLAAFHAAVPGCKVEHDGGVIEPQN
jgi:serine/threonine protein kinase